MLRKLLFLTATLLFFACPQPETALTIDVTVPESNIGVDGFSVYSTDVEFKWEVLEGSGKYITELEINGESTTLEDDVSTFKITDEGKYFIDAFIYDKKTKEMGVFSLQIMIDKTAPDLSKISYKDLILYTEYADFKDTPNDDNQLTDNLSGVDFSTLEFKWQNELDEGKTDADLVRLISVSDLAGNKTEGSYTVKVRETILPNKIELKTEIATLTYPTQLEVAVYPENANDKSLTYTCNPEDIFFVSDSGLITPLKDGTADLTIASKVDSEVSIKVTITVVTDELYFGDIHLVRVKSYDFKGTELPEDWSATGGTATVTATGLTFAGNAAELKLEIPTATIGEFDYIQVKYKRTASETYAPNIYVFNTSAPGTQKKCTKLLYRNTDLGFGDNWKPTAKRTIGYKGGDDFILWGGMKIDNSKALVNWNELYYELDYSTTTDTWYNSGNGNLQFGMTHDTQDTTVTTTIENISFFKKAN